MSKNSIRNEPTFGRREFVASVSMLIPFSATIANAEPGAESLDIDKFLRSGVDGGGNMGVSSQAGKSRPETGVILRDGSEVSRDKKSGAVAAEILLGKKEDPTSVIVNFASPWSLATGSVFDVECRDGKTGDGVFLAVSANTKGKKLSELPDSFLFERLFNPSGRFSFYGPPTDIKVKNSIIKGDTRYIELKFSNLSQSTGAEIPRNCIVAAKIPEGTQNVVMLVSSASALRWKKGSEDMVRKTIDTFQVTAAPKSRLKIRAKPRAGEFTL